MSDSEQDDVEETRMYSNDEAWKDIKPIPKDEGEHPAVPIMASAAFEDRMSYFRAILKLNEMSERALKLTEDVIELNAANYTAWHWRRLCLDHLKSDLKQELVYVTDMALSSPKNYQIWYHRRAVIERLNDGSGELAFTAKILEDDSKNYHAWSHRQWAMTKFNLWEKELSYTAQLIEVDPRNNSAWNQRWFVVFKTKLEKVQKGEDAKNKIHSICEEEVDFALKYMKLTPNNDSPFNYARGMVQLIGIPKPVRDLADDENNFKSFGKLKSELLELRKQFLSEGKLVQACAPPLLGLLVDIHEDFGETEAMKLIVNSLATKFDTIRKKYWKSRLTKKMHF